jgi:hypothetical protein
MRQIDGDANWRSGMALPYVVFCTDFQQSTDYVHFCHEADVLLGTLGIAVREQKLTVRGACRLWDRYKAFYPEMYDEAFDEEEGFPDIESTGFDFMPATEAFVEDACSVGVPGAGVPKDATPMSGVIFEVIDREALDKLREQLNGRYRIVVRENADYMFPATIDAAEAIIASGREFLNS